MTQGARGPLPPTDQDPSAGDAAALDAAALDAATLPAAARNPAALAQGGPWLLALHSSSDCLGLGLQQLGAPAAACTLRHAPLGRRLSQDLFQWVEDLLPACAWPQLGRLAVATGPGGFTGTRLTVVLARTLAQQLQVPLDGLSSFQLMAHRLLPPAGPAACKDSPRWLLQELPRHGLVAGLYGREASSPGGIREWQPPRLYRTAAELSACAAALGAPWQPGDGLTAEPALPQDVAELLRLSQAAAAAGRPGPWAPVLPLYPTSPVGNA